MKSKPISVLIVEDHPITRAGLKLTLQQDNLFDIVGDALDGSSAVDKALKLRPEVILMDIGLPNTDGIEATWQIKQALPMSRVIMLTSHDRDEDISAALGVGADGYCLKDITAEQLVQGITTVTTGVQWFDPRIVLRMRAHQTENFSAGKISRILCARELEILRLLEQGVDNAAIAERMSMQIGLIETYKRNIMEKLFHLDRSQSTRNNVPNKNKNRKSLPQNLSVEAPSSCAATEGLSVGATFADRYAIESFIGEGGMGLVYQARHVHMNRRVAIKVLHSKWIEDRNLVRRFQQESMTASSLSHPNVISIFDFGIASEGQPFLVMDYLNGCGLDAIISKEEHLGLDRFLRIFTQVCDGLAAAHARDIVHCDLKPSNIMLVKDDKNRETVKIVDFGLSVVLPRDQSIQSQVTESFEVFGSPWYMSPEQCTGSKLDCRSDIYSLGCVMYEAITGKPVFKAKSPFEMFAMQIRSTPQRFAAVCPQKAIPQDLERIVFKALAKDPAERYQSVLDMRRDILGLRHSIS